MIFSRLVPMKMVGCVYWSWFVNKNRSSRWCRIISNIWWPEKVGYIIAGGVKALTPIENAEDNIEEAKKDVDRIKLSKNDVVIVISASGNTPYTCKV